MAIIIRTKDPRKLLRNINQQIDNQHIKTWKYDEEGDYTAVSLQWRYRAWMHPILPDQLNHYPDDVLIFGIVGSRSYKMTKEIYGVYHGRFITTILAHFDTEIEEIRPTTLLQKGIDRVNDIL